MAGRTDRKGADGEASESPISLSGLVDDDLVGRSIAGETRAFDELVARYADKVHRLTFKILRHEQDAEDAMQDAFLSAYRNLPRFKRKSTFSTWLYRVASNAALMRLRKRRAGMVSIDQPSREEDGHSTLQLADWSRTPVEDLMNEELGRALSDSIHALPEELQEVFVLRELQGMSNLQTADELKLTVPAVKSRLHRARVELRQRLEHFFTAPSGDAGPEPA